MVQQIELVLLVSNKKLFHHLFLLRVVLVLQALVVQGCLCRNILAVIPTETAKCFKVCRETAELDSCFETRRCDKKRRGD